MSAPRTGTALWREPAPTHLPDPLLVRWKAALTEWNAPASTHAALDRLTARGTHVVVTGQQPGPWGGPLFAFYKAATAVALAEQIRDSGHPAVAVFWIQGDDTDWDEVAWGTLPYPDLRLLRHRWPSPGARRWVGSETLAVPTELPDLLASWGSTTTLRMGPLGQEPEELTPTFARALLAAFGDRGLLPLDARWPDVRRAGESLWRSYVPRHDALRRSLEDTSARLAAGGDATPLTGATLDHGLFVLDDGTRRLTDPATWTDQVEGLLRNGESERLAPSVLLRAPLQDHLLGSAAHVVGDTEGAYLRQLAPVYEALAVAAPARVARLAATVVPRGLLPPGEAAACLADPEAWIAAQARKAAPAAALAALADLRRDVDRHLASFRAGAHGLGKDVDEIEEAAAKKIDREIARLEETLDRRGRQAVYRETPALRQIGEFLAPRRAAQERGLSAASLDLLLGEDAMGAVDGAARSHLQRLGQGERKHFILGAS